MKLSTPVYLTTLGELLLNWVAVTGIILSGVAFYAAIPWYREFFSFSYSAGYIRFDHLDFFSAFIAAYLLLLIPYYATLPSGTITKSVCLWRWLLRGRWRTIENHERVALLATALKGYYIPLMAVAFLFHCTQMTENGSAWWHSGVFFPDGYWFCFRLILLFDVLFFTIGYLIEHPKLGNEISSVDSTLLGWAVTLLCYPPANELTTRILGNYTTNYPLWSLGTEYAFFSAAAILLLHIVYASSAVVLNLRASNLTYRGLVTSGPYRYIRHPAYSAKVLAWWAGSLPLLWIQFSHAGLWGGLQGVIGIGGWTGIYILRAITEERHLMKQSQEYQLYCSKVPYRFIPGMI